ncbi:MAG: diguanylate cyclase, partial [Sulfurimonas sp.]|nr:diguanylate cyclase [Sulfurimonas sp.]
DADLSLSILKDEKGKPIGMIGYSQDITKQKEIERKLEESRDEILKQKEVFETIYNGSKDAIAILDMESNFLQVNPAYIEMTGMSEEELLKTSCTALAAPKDIERLQLALEEVMRVGYVKNFEKDCITKSGKYITINMFISLLHNPDRILISGRDVTALKKVQNELKLLASTDPMTKLYNRRQFTESSESILDLSKRNQTDLSVIMIDIDNFKNINDKYGHKVGDEVIITLASILKELSRKSDIVSRWGGEEFVILLPETNIDGAFVISEKIRTKVENLIMNIEKNKEFKFTISLGVSKVNNKDDLNIEASINRADKALYEAKESGKNRVKRG